MITTKPINISALEAQLNDPSCGGVVTFVGKVRNHHDGKQVTNLTYEAYAPMAEKIFKLIATEGIEKFGVKEIKIIHRVGDLQIGDVAVWVGVQSAHRAEAFEACQYAIDELKKRAPIWKKEYYANAESEWVRCHHEEKKVAVILAGGQSKRFGWVDHSWVNYPWVSHPSDKLLVKLNGKTFIEMLIETLGQCGFQIIISGPKKKFGPIGLPIIEDEHPHEGPLSALSSIWKKISADKILVVAGDMPFITPSVIEALWSQSRKADITLLENGEKSSPLPAVYSRKTASAADKLLEKGRRDLMSLWNCGLEVQTINEKIDDQRKSLININTLSDLHKWHQSSLPIPE